MSLQATTIWHQVKKAAIKMAADRQCQSFKAKHWNLTIKKKYLHISAYCVWCCRYFILCKNTFRMENDIVCTRVYLGAGLFDVTSVTISWLPETWKYYYKTTCKINYIQLYSFREHRWVAQMHSNYTSSSPLVYKVYISRYVLQITLKIHIGRQMQHIGEYWISVNKIPTLQYSV